MTPRLTFFELRGELDRVPRGAQTFRFSLALAGESQVTGRRSSTNLLFIKFLTLLDHHIG
jgi:hypothetical protein